MPAMKARLSRQPQGIYPRKNIKDKEKVIAKAQQAHREGCVSETLLQTIVNQHCYHKTLALDFNGS